MQRNSPQNNKKLEENFKLKLKEKKQKKLKVEKGKEKIYSFGMYECNRFYNSKVISQPPNERFPCGQRLGDKIRVVHPQKPRIAEQ